MPRASRSTDALVGAFVVLGALAVVTATMWARQVQVGGHAAAVTSRFRDVGNAGVGTGVFIRGVRAGRISGLELGDDGWVRARLTLDPEVRLPADPVVVLGASSLFGEWQATVTPRGAAPEHPDVARQLADAAGERGTLPGATLPDVAQLTAVAGRIADDVGAVAGRVRVAFDDSAARDLRATIANTAALSATLASTARRQASAVDAMAAELRSGTHALAEAGGAAQRTFQRADSATSSGDVQRAVRDAAAAAADLRAGASELRATAHRAAAMQLALDGILARSDSVLEKLNGGRGTAGRLLNDPSLYRNTDSLVAELRALVTDLRANPKRYVNVRLF